MILVALPRRMNSKTFVKIVLSPGKKKYFFILATVTKVSNSINRCSFIVSARYLKLLIQNKYINPDESRDFLFGANCCLTFSDGVYSARK